MDIKSVGYLNQAKPAELSGKKDKKETPKKNDVNPEVVFEKSTGSEGVKGDYSKIAKENQKLTEVDKLKMQLDHKMQNAFYLMAKDVMDGQNVGLKAAIEKILEERSDEITPEMIEEAQQDVAEGGFFSVEKTTERIMDFAKAISGDDPSKAGLLRDAFEKGFEEAAGIWDDELPQISKDTYDAVMEAFDEWENESIESDSEENDTPDQTQEVESSKE